MASLVWLLIPVMAVCISGLWSSWATRRRTNGGGDAAGVAGYDAFRSAMEKSGKPEAPVASRIPDDVPSLKTSSATDSDPSPSGTLDEPAQTARSGGPVPERVPTGVTTDSPSRAAN